MAGVLHQGLIALFQEDPWLAFDILGIPRPVEGMPIDRRAEVEREGKKPLTVRQGYPDLVLVHDGGSPEQKIVITVEAQAAYDGHKRWMLPVYQSHLAEEHESETWVVVLSLCKSFSNALRAWAVGGPPRVDVLLLDVESVPKSPWLDDPARRPMAAVLVGALHGYAGDFEAARCAFHATRTMPEERRRRHGMTILAALTKEQQDRLLEELPMEERNAWIEVERRSGIYQLGREEGLEQGLERGLEQGLERGLERGLEQGLEQGLERGLEQGRMELRELIFELLATRGIDVDAASEERIRSCEDLKVLRLWVRRAVDVASASELSVTPTGDS